MSETVTNQKTRKLGFIQALNEALVEAMEADDKVLVFGEDVADREGGGVVGITRGLSTRFGDDRVKSTPISEQAIIGAAIGASMMGFKPVAEIMLMNFTTVAMDMIVNHAAKLRFMSGGQTGVPITIRMMTGAGLSTAGQHADFLEAWFAHVPGLKVVAPSNPADAKGLLLSCIADPDPCLFIETMRANRTSAEVPEKIAPVPLGKAKVVREGSDVTIISYAEMFVRAQKAADQLAEEGISAELIDLRTISPWDRETVIASVAKTGRAVVAHEAVCAFGVGAEIAAVLMSELFGRLKAPVMRLGAPYAPVPFAKNLEDAYVLSADAIAQAARETMAQA
ncbi:alpha-ketoacid dehydrogenase subunit beta [Novosphingobium pentaromativorans]|uniref:Transketolase, central region n=1 Tax=Novosphingobium pentaromativorans US6-1 TaxID=1088721 RepID=G6E835_9SPHN|nr:alpha-ketoacid dehydrogenase subunit beta [Novosphingobium pentaromativorans]AIT81457.1 pyruvate dehydrogenase [Novosphingobium pentaromativorans US6-1]EHJ62375.1 Transketolase, central region [Novosphingobium pentaromativorans US6-1]